MNNGSYKSRTMEEQPSKYQLVYDHPNLFALVPSGKTPHLDALSEAGLLDLLTIDQLAIIVQLMQQAYRNGQAFQGAEKIDNDCVWLDGIGGLEKQSDGTWKLTMTDNVIDKSDAAAALGSIKSERKARTSAENGRKGGRPRKAKNEPAS